MPMIMVLLSICVLMQSSVNAFNDYFDFIKGTDTADDMLEADDSTLVNDHISPRSALVLAIVLLTLAFALGLCIILVCGFTPLWIALIGAAAVILYSAGKTPISALPIGELVSGLVMGGLIPLACFFCLTGSLDPLVLVFAIPQIVGVGLIMMTNNACDIEKDRIASRRTLPALLGRAKTRRLYHACIIGWLLAICIICGLRFWSGLWVVPLMLLASLPLVKPLWKNPLEQRTRIPAMGGIATLNVTLGAFYALCILA